MADEGECDWPVCCQRPSGEQSAAPGAAPPAESKRSARRARTLTEMRCESGVDRITLADYRTW